MVANETVCARDRVRRGRAGRILRPTTLNPQPYFPDEKTEGQHISGRIRFQIYR